MFLILKECSVSVGVCGFYVRSLKKMQQPVHCVIALEKYEFMHNLSVVSTDRQHDAKVIMHSKESLLLKLSLTFKV